MAAGCEGAGERAAASFCSDQCSGLRALSLVLPTPVQVDGAAEPGMRRVVTVCVVRNDDAHLTFKVAHNSPYPARFLLAKLLLADLTACALLLHPAADRIELRCRRRGSGGVSGLRVLLGLQPLYLDCRASSERILLLQLLRSEIHLGLSEGCEVVVARIELSGVGLG